MKNAPSLQSISMADMIEQGYLVPPTYIMPAALPDMDLAQSGIAHYLVNPYLRHCEGKRAIVFCNSATQCEMVTAEFVNHGIPAAAVLAKQNHGERTANIERFKAGDLMVLTSCNVLLDSSARMPEVDVVIIATQTNSPSRYTSFVAAAMHPRPEPRQPGESSVDYNNRLMQRTVADRRASIAASDKPRALILDVVGNGLRLGFPDTQES
jgi:hypothetical protein